MDLSTTYLGLDLANPVIAGASNLTADIDTVKKLEQAGVGAVVIKSLFEEQIQLEHYKFDEEQEKYNYRHPMMVQVGPDIEYQGAREHFAYVKRVKKNVQIPVIASLNAVNHDTWVEYAERLADTGVDALELNFFASPRDAEHAGDDVEKEQAETLRTIKEKVSVPISVKLSPFYSNPLNFIRKIDEVGVDGLVLFNRMFHPDINAEKEEHSFAFNLSHETDSRLPLRFAGLLYDEVKASICCSTGIFTGEDVAKMVLAGADCVQIVSALYKHKAKHVDAIVAELKKWMEEKNYASLADFRGKMSRKNIKNPWVYTRAQYSSLLMQPNPLQVEARPY